MEGCGETAGVVLAPATGARADLFDEEDPLLTTVDRGRTEACDVDVLRKRFERDECQSRSASK